MFAAELKNADTVTISSSSLPSSGVGEIEDLSHALNMLAKVDWADLPGEVVVDGVVDLVSLRNRVDAQLVAASKKVDRTRALAEAGFQSVAGLLQRGGHVPKVQASRYRTLAGRLHLQRSLLPVEESFAAGRIGFDQASLIAMYSTREEVAWAFDQAVAEFFVPTAEANDFAFFKRACEAWYEAADVTQGDARDRRHDARQKVRVSRTFDGAVRIDGFLPTIAGETVHNEFERLRRHLYDQDWAAAMEKLGRDPKPDELGRTADERSVAALVLMAERSASNGDQDATNLPVVNVLMDFATFEAVNRELLGLPATYPQGGVCRTEAGTPVSPRDALETMLKGFVRRVVFDPKTMRLDFGRKQRYFTGGLREAIILRDQTCVVPGCDVPARFAQIDHCTSWASLGETNIFNGNARCRFHNGVKGRRSTRPVNIGFNYDIGQVGFKVDAHEKTYESSKHWPPPPPPPNPIDQSWISQK